MNIGLIILLVLIWLGLGFLGRCWSKHYFIERYAITSTWLTEEEAWGKRGEAMGIFITLIGICGLISTALCQLLIFDKENPYTHTKINKWGLRI